MPPVGRYLSKRLEHESTLMEPRVRQDERGRLRHQTSIIEEIEIEHAGGVSLAADTTKLSLDRLQRCEQVARGEMGYQRRDRVNEPWLVRERYRLVRYQADRVATWTLSASSATRAAASVSGGAPNRGLARLPPTPIRINLSLIRFGLLDPGCTL